MELTLYILLTWVSVFFTYLAFSKNVDQTPFNKLIAGLCWVVVGVNTLVLHYYIPNGSVSSYTSITDNSEYWQIILAPLYGLVGISIWYQMIIDQHLQRAEEEYAGT